MRDVAYWPKANPGEPRVRPNLGLTHLLQPWLSSRREVPWGWQVSAPAEAGGDMFKDRLDDVGVIVDTKLIRDGQEQCVSLCDSFVVGELLDEDVRRGGVAADKNGSCVVAEEADSVLVLVPASEIG